MRLQLWVVSAVLLASAAFGATAHAQLLPVQRAGIVSIDYAMLDRELTLPDGKAEAAGRFQTLDIGGFSISGLAFTLGYGVADVAEVWAEPVVLIDPETELGFNFGAAIRVLNGETVDMAPQVAVPINVTAPGDTVPTMSFGLDTRIKLGDIASLFLLHGLVNPLFVADTVLILANVGLGLQLVDILGLRVDTMIVGIETAGGETIHWGDAIPFGIDALITAGSIDAFLGVAFPDLENAGDIYVLTLGVMGRF